MVSREWGATVVTLGTVKWTRTLGHIFPVHSRREGMRPFLIPNKHNRVSNLDNEQDYFQ